MNKTSRRAFLQMTGASPFLLPLLEPDLARAGCLTTPRKRVVFVLWGNGMLPGNERANWPAPAETLQLTAPLKSLEPVREDLLFIDALNYAYVLETPLGQIQNQDPNGHYAQEGLLTGRKYLPYGYSPWESKATGPSLDQHLGAELVKRGYKGIPSLYLGVRIHYPEFAVWRGPSASVAPDWDPTKIFAKLFAGREGVAPDPELARLVKARKSVLDSVHDDFDRFSKIVGADDRARVQRHLDSIRSIEMELLAVRPPPACKVPDLDLSVGGIAPSLDVLGDGTFVTAEDEKIPGLLKLHIDMLVAAMASDVTRVAVLQFSDCNDHRWSMPWLGINDSYHRIAHGLAGKGAEGSLDMEPKLRADQWFHSQWAYLLGQMKAEKEGSSSLLDSSVVAFFNNMTHGFHECRDVPAFLAGGCGGYFKTGRSIKNTVRNQYHQPLLVSIANALLGEGGLSSFGDPEYQSGEMPGLRG